MRKVADSHGTHIPLLVRMFDLSTGPVLELGTGRYSTPVLHWLANMSERHVISCEIEPKWYERAKRMASPYHHIVAVRSWDELPTEHVGLAFIDSAPAESRSFLIAKYALVADYLVVHDTEAEQESVYGMAPMLAMFTHRYDYTKLRPHTTVVSNRFDLGGIL